MAADYYLYMLLCEGNAYYTGITTNVEQRFQQHRHGKGAKYTRSHKPIKIVGKWHVGPSRATAQAIEYQIKRLSHAEKDALIQQPTLFTTTYLTPEA